MKDVRKYISWSNDANQHFFVVPSFFNSVLGKLFQRSTPACNLWVWGTPVSGRWSPGPWSNINMSSYQYRKLYCGDKTVVRSSNLCNGISYTGKMASLYWFRPLVLYSLSDLIVRSREVSKLRDSRLDFSGSDFSLLITLKFDRRLGSSAIDMPVKLQSDTIMVNLAASRLHEIWRYYSRLVVWPCCRLLRLRWRWGSHR